MGRRRRRQDASVFEDIYEMLKGTPWWVGPVLAVFAFILFRYLLPLLFTAKPGEIDPGGLIRPLLSTVSWFVGGAILFVWLLAEGYKLTHRAPSTALRSFDGPPAPRGQAMQANGAPTPPRHATQTAPSPLCPDCGSEMVMRTARKGTSAGSQFWGCPRYPQCRGTRPL